MKYIYQDHEAYYYEDHDHCYKINKSEFNSRNSILTLVKSLIYNIIIVFIITYNLQNTFFNSGVRTFIYITGIVVGIIGTASFYQRLMEKLFMKKELATVSKEKSHRAIQNLYLQFILCFAVLICGVIGSLMSYGSIRYIAYSLLVVIYMTLIGSYVIIKNRWGKQ